MPDVFVNNQTVPPSSAAPTANVITPLIPPVPEEHHVHVLSSFCQNPIGITFNNQNPGEKILLLLRRHFITNVPWIFFGTLLLLAPTLLRLLMGLTDVSLFPSLPSSYLLVFMIFYYLFIFTFFFVNFMTWYYNVSLVTTERIIDVDFSEIIYKNVAATKISLIQDTNFTQTGVIRTFFDYGDVFVQTAGSIDNFDFLAVPHPQRVVQIIEDLIGKERPRV